MNNSDMIEMPFPERGLSVPEIACILEIAQELNLRVQKKGAVSNYKIIIELI